MAGNMSVKPGSPESRELKDNARDAVDHMRAIPNRDQNRVAEFLCNEPF